MENTEEYAGLCRMIPAPETWDELIQILRSLQYPETSVKIEEPIEIIHDPTEEDLIAFHNCD